MSNSSLCPCSNPAGGRRRPRHAPGNRPGGWPIRDDVDLVILQPLDRLGAVADGEPRLDVGIVRHEAGNRPGRKVFCGRHDPGRREPRRTPLIASRPSISKRNCSSIACAASTALIQKACCFETEEDGIDRQSVVIAADAFGLRSPSRAVECWLATQAGGPFRGKQAAPSDGYFTGLLAHLRQER